ncbi:MAG: response regulator, partial [bacterium]
MSTILLVEDDVNTRTGLFEILTEEGYHVESAEDGADALKIMESGIIDLLLSDLRLPDLSGLELHEKVKRVHPELITIIMTAYSFPEYRLHRCECHLRRAGS